VKLVQVFWDRIRVHLDMRILRPMSLEVDLEVSFRGKSISTDITLERSLASMGSNVYLKGRIRAKDFAAVSTSVSVGRVLLAILSELEEVVLTCSCHAVDEEG